MATNFEQVLEFHYSFDVPINDEPEHPELRRVELRLDLIAEEHEEVIKAVFNEGLPEIAKELCDLLYVVYGMGAEFGIDMDACFAEVHRSNMTKLGADGRPVIRESDGKVLKGPLYEEADMEKILACRSDMGVVSRSEAKDRAQ